MKTYNLESADDSQSYQLSREYEEYLLARGYNPSTCRSYARTLMHERIRAYMQGYYHCNTIYQLNNVAILRKLVEEVYVESRDFTSRVRNATMRYIEFLQERQAQEKFDEKEKLIKSRIEIFKSYLRRRRIAENTVSRYCNILKSGNLKDEVRRRYSVSSFYELNSVEDIKSLIEQSGLNSIDQHHDMRACLRYYIDMVTELGGSLCSKDNRPLEELDAARIGMAQFEETIEIAMHANILDAYNYFVMEHLRETGIRKLVLNEAYPREYWEQYMKKAISFLLSDEFEGMGEKFMNFFNADGRINPQVLYRAFEEETSGAKCWEYWQTIARWKMAERIHEFYYEYVSVTEEWMPEQAFDQNAAKQLSNIERDFSVYTPTEIRKCAERVKAIILEKDRFDGGCSQVPSQELQDTALGPRLKGKMLQERKKANYEATGELERMAQDNLFSMADYNNRKDTIAELQNKLKQTEDERDAACKEVAVLKGEVANMKEDQSEMEVVDHRNLVANIFEELALRYMNSSKRKSVSTRTKVQEHILAFVNALKIHIDDDVLKCINSFDDENPPVVPQVNIHNEYVMEKNVTTEIGKVESGATGAIIKQSKPKNR